MSAPSAPSSTYAGQRLGMPATGPGSIAGWGRRFAALAVDWVACLLVAAALTGGRSFTSDGAESWLTLLVFLVEATVLTWLLGGSFGQAALGVAVVHLDRTRLNPVAAFVRTLLICLVVPPLFTDADRRGLHDLATASVPVRR